MKRRNPYQKLACPSCRFPTIDILLPSDMLTPLGLVESEFDFCIFKAGSAPADISRDLVDTTEVPSLYTSYSVRKFESGKARAFC
jgi:hypothetical protein